MHFSSEVGIPPEIEYSLTTHAHSSTSSSDEHADRPFTPPTTRLLSVLVIVLPWVTRHVCSPILGLELFWNRGEDEGAKKPSS